MKKTELKFFIKKILKEIYKRQLNEWTSGELDDYQIELEKPITGISNEGDIVIVDVKIDYELSSGSPERGQFGPAYKASQAEGPEVQLGTITITGVKVFDSQSHQIKAEIDDIKTLTPDQKNVIEQEVNVHIDAHEDAIKDEILDKNPDSGDSGDSGGDDDYFEDR